jgi:hypothetical protein
LDHLDPRAGLVEADVRNPRPASEEDLDSLYDGSAGQVGSFVRKGGAAGSIRNEESYHRAAVAVRQDLAGMTVLANLTLLCMRRTDRRGGRDPPSAMTHPATAHPSGAVGFESGTASAGCEWDTDPSELESH